MLGLGNQVSSNSAACATGTEALLLAYERIASGKAERMLAGACNSHGPYAWGGFDSMRVLNRQSNDAPERASRPMSATAAGFVPGSGAGALLLESLESARRRGARIYAELLGGALNSGGHRQGGSMTAPNPQGVLRCIGLALENAGVRPEEVDLISGHLTATMGDPLEVNYWSQALKREGKEFPYINSLKSMVGHCLGASGAIECVAAVLQLAHQKVHPSINCEDIHPDIETLISPDCIPQKAISPKKLDVVAKSSFGFGDVNACVLFRRWGS
jgi:3-oxoacyl-(acyl-carrier-protein) synthase